MIKIFPAIDIIDGFAVRLTEGDYDRKIIYNDSPVNVAADFERVGAKYLHVVDLDGAKYGSEINFPTVKKIVDETSLFVEIGGGIRDEDRIKKYLDIGVSRVILGTVAVKNFEFCRKMIEKYGEKIAVGVDCRNGYVSTSGWLDDSTLNGYDFCVKLRDSGLSTVIYTDISRDGMLSGCNIELYKRLSEIKGLNIVASGGITSESELNELDGYVDGAIIGKALYEGKISLTDALEYQKE